MVKVTEEEWNKMRYKYEVEAFRAGRYDSMEHSED
jgi:hypothetical protein